MEERKKVLRRDKSVSMALQECWVINTGDKEEGRNADEGGGNKIAFACLFILKDI